jgi:hypothetical protein
LIIFYRAVRTTHPLASLDDLLAENGFDRDLHDQIRADLKAGRIGLAQNRLPANSVIEDVRDEDVADFTAAFGKTEREALHIRGLAALHAGEVGVVSLAAGQARDGPKALEWSRRCIHSASSPGGIAHFLEVHLAKSAALRASLGTPVSHIFTTSYLTHQPIAEYLKREKNYAYPGPVVLSRSANVGLRLVPTQRDLRFAWEEMPQQVLDEQQQKVRDRRGRHSPAGLSRPAKPAITPTTCRSNACTRSDTSLRCRI